MKSLLHRQIETELTHAGAVAELMKYRGFAKRFARVILRGSALVEGHCIHCSRYLSIGEGHKLNCIRLVASRFLQRERSRK